MHKLTSNFRVKVFAGALTLFFAVNLNAAIVSLSFTNVLGQFDTNVVKIIPVQSPILANGGFITRGPATINTPTNGVVKISLMQGPYLATNAVLASGFLFAVPSGTNSYTIGVDLQPISGFNLFNYTPGVNTITSTNGSINVALQANGQVDLSVSNVTFTTASNALSAVSSTGAQFATNFVGTLSPTNLPSGLSSSNYVGTFYGNLAGATNLPVQATATSANNATNFFGVVTFTNLPNMSYGVSSDLGGHSYINTTNKIVLHAYGTNASNAPGAILALERPNSQSRAEIDFPMPGADVNDANYGTNYIAIGDDYAYNGDYFALMFDARLNNDMLQYGLNGNASGRFHFGQGNLGNGGNEYTNYYVSISDPYVALGIVSPYTLGILSYSNGYFAKMLQTGDAFTLGSDGDGQSFYAMSKENGAIVVRHGWANTLSSAAYADYISTNTTSTAVNPGVMLEYWQPSSTTPYNSAHWSIYANTFSNTTDFEAPITASGGLNIASAGSPSDAVSITSGGDGANFIAIKKENGAIVLRQGFVDLLSGAAYGTFVSTNSSSTPAAPGVLLDYWQPNPASPSDSTHWSLYKTTISNQFIISPGWGIDGSGAGLSNVPPAGISASGASAGWVLAYNGSIVVWSNELLIVTNEALRQATALTNGAVLNLSNLVATISANSTNEAMRQATSLTNGAVANLSNYVASVSANATNEALRQATSVTNGAIANLSNYVASVSLNATNQSLQIGQNDTNQTWLIGANSTNQTWLIGQNDTNQTWKIGLNDTNQTWLIGQNATNEASRRISNLLSGVNVWANNQEWQSGVQFDGGIVALSGAAFAGTANVGSSGSINSSNEFQVNVPGGLALQVTTNAFLFAGKTNGLSLDAASNLGIGGNVQSATASIAGAMALSTTTTQVGYDLHPTISQGGTAGFSVIKIDPTINSTGSGAHDAIEVYNSASLTANIAITGAQTNTGPIQATAFYGALHGNADTATSATSATTATFATAATTATNGPSTGFFSTSITNSGNIQSLTINTSGRGTFSNVTDSGLTPNTLVGTDAGSGLSSYSGSTSIAVSGGAVSFTGNYSVPVVSKITNYTVATTDSGNHFNNTGAAGAITNTLPASAAGLFYQFAVTANQNLAVKAGGTDTIASVGTVSAAGGIIFSSTQRSVVQLECEQPGQWIVTSTNGNWTIQ